MLDYQNSAQTGVLERHVHVQVPCGASYIQALASTGLRLGETQNHGSNVCS